MGQSPSLYPKTSGTGRNSRRTWVAVGLVLAVASTSCTSKLRRDTSGSSVPVSPVAVDTVAPLAPSTTPAPTKPANDRLIAEIVSDKLTLERATQLFSLEVQPLPGVTVPSGDVTPVMSGTYAYSLAASYYDQLTPAQQKVLDDLFVQGGDVGDVRGFDTPPKLPPLPEGATHTTSDTSTATKPTFRQTSFTRGAALPVPALDAYFRPMYEWANKAISAMTGRLRMGDFVLVFGPMQGPTWAATTTYRTDGERYTSIVEQVDVHACHSHIDLAKFTNQPAEVQLSVVTHEVFHCFQQDATGTAQDVVNANPWVEEGEATWAQMALVPPASFTALQNHWNEYISDPKTHLFDRRYDAAGFFGHVADVAGDGFVWSTLIPAFLAAPKGDEAAFGVVVAGVEDKVLDTWAPSYFRAHQGQFLWDMKGPGTVNMPSQSPTPEEISVASGGSTSLPSIGSWELGLVRLHPHADVLTVVTTVGHSALVDANNQLNKVLTSGEPLTLCLIGSCVCPPDQEGIVPPTIPATAPLDIGITGGRNGATGWVHASSLSDFCKRKKLPDPPPGGGGGGGGGSPGAPDGPQGPSLEPPTGKSLSDPHLVTFDGRRYDMHSVGEFVLARSTEDSFTVQARFETRASRVWSTATMMATKVGADRVTVSLDLLAAQAVPVLRVNGEVVRDGFRLLNGGSVRTVASNYGDNYVVEFRDGTRVGAESTARGGLTIWVDPAPARKGKLTGLLGNADGNADNDPVVGGTSTVLSEKPAYDELYGTFAPSWRITTGTSLFDYRPGESTATFTDATFPDRNTSVAPEATVNEATKLCADSGVTDAGLLANCAFDIAATGERAYVLAYQPQQLRLDTWLVLLGNGKVTTPTSTGRTQSVVLDGTVAAASDKKVETFQGFKGDVIYVDPPDCVAPRSMSITGPDGSAVGGPAVSCGQRIVLPADGAYHVDMNPFQDTAARYHVPLVAVRPDLIRDLKPGDTMTGSIANRAEHDVFRVQARAGDTITIGGGDCNAKFDATVLFGDNELVTGGGGCALGTIMLPKAGTYQIVINPFDSAIGDYRIPTSR